MLPTCSHAFHIDCIDTWLQSNSTCPLCRNTLFNHGLPMYNPCFEFDDMREADESSLAAGIKTVENERLVAEKGVFLVRLGKFRKLTECEEKTEIGETSSSKLDARRCYSMGSYEYVVGDSSLKVALNRKRDRQEEKIVEGEEGNVNLKVNDDDMEGKKISIGVKTDSYSVSKIWLWSKKGKLVSSSENEMHNPSSVDMELPWMSKMQERVLIKVRAEDCGNGAPISKLRDATLEGNWWRAQSILRKYRFEITIKINNVDETMLHLAVGEGKNYFVQKLLNSIQDEELIEKRNNKGQTALHIAAIVGNKHAAELLVKKRDNLLYVKDNLGKVPLLIAYTTNHISTFAYLFKATKTACELLPTYDDFNSFEEFIIRLIYRKEYGLAFELYKLHLKSPEEPKDKVLMAITRNFPSDFSFWEALIYPSWEHAAKKIVKRSSLLFYSFEDMYARVERTLWRMKRFKNNYYSWLLPEIVMLLLVPIAVLYPVCQLILLFISVLLLPFRMLYSLLWKVLATVVAPIKDIEKRKKEYEEANFFLHNTVRHMDSCNLDNSIFYKFIALEAVRLDVYEVLHLIISHFNKTIEYTNERHNIIQLAIIHRSEKVYNHIFYPLIKQKKSQRELKDYSGNNLLHLVGRLAPSHKLSCTTGAALQLQRELQWREEVEKFMEPMELTQRNTDDETPDMVFTREHAELVKDGEKWMKATAESCSITAALIVTIVFAAAITVPGGSNQETGIPLFKKQIAFTVFAISYAISLFSASTSLLVFLSILTNTVC